MMKYFKTFCYEPQTQIDTICVINFIMITRHWKIKYPQTFDYFQNFQKLPTKFSNWARISLSI